jgi:hypothetical protein
VRSADRILIGRTRTLIDRLILALAIASPMDGPETFDLGYAEAMVMVFDVWLERKSEAD